MLRVLISASILWLMSLLIIRFEIYACSRSIELHTNDKNNSMLCRFVLIFIVDYTACRSRILLMYFAHYIRLGVAVQLLRPRLPAVQLRHPYLQEP